MHQWIFFVRATPFDNTVRKKSRDINIFKLFNDLIGIADANSQTTAMRIEDYETQLHLKRKIRLLYKYQDMQ